MHVTSLSSVLLGFVVCVKLHFHRNISSILITHVYRDIEDQDMQIHINVLTQLRP